MIGSGSKRLVMLGVDAADLDYIRRHQERLPVFRRLLSLGQVRRLDSPADRMAGAVWPTFYTASLPQEHGIYHHLQWDPQRMRLRRVSRRWLDCEPFWSSLVGRGLKAVVVDIPMLLPTSCPPAVEITNWGSHDQLSPLRVHPPGLSREVCRRFGKQHPMGWEIPVRKSWPEMVKICDRLIGGARRKGELCRWLLGTQEWDFFLAVFGECHRGGHLLWPREGENSAVPPGALLEVYQAVDEALGRVWELVPSHTSLVVFSLHGMGPNTSQEHFLPAVMDRINRGVGKTGSFLRKNKNGVGQRSLMRWLRERLPPALQNAVAQRVPVEIRDAVVNRAVTSGWDWSRTPAFPLLADLQGYIRLNLQGREAKGFLNPDREECDRYVDWACRCLHSLKAETGEPLVSQVHVTDFRCAPGRTRYLPDLIVNWREGPQVTRAFSSILGEVSAVPSTGRSGNHRPRGFSILVRPAGRPGSVSAPAHITDLARMAEQLLCL